MALLYRLLTEDDGAEFCHKISLALSKGWTLHGDPVLSFDAARGVMRCGQAVIKDTESVYDPAMKLGQQ